MKNFIQVLVLFLVAVIICFMGFSAGMLCVKTALHDKYMVKEYQLQLDQQTEIMDLKKLHANEIRALEERRDQRGNSILW